MNLTVAHKFDGWPLCPFCGADELLSSAAIPRPTDALRCLACGWAGTVPARGSSVRPVTYNRAAPAPMPMTLDVNASSWRRVETAALRLVLRLGLRWLAWRVL